MPLIVKNSAAALWLIKKRIFNVAKRCIEDYEAGNDVVVVLSAMGKTTDRLIEMARDINPKASKRDGYAPGNRRADICCINVHGYGTVWAFLAVSLNAFQVVMHTTSARQQCKIKNELIPSVFSMNWNREESLSLPVSRESINTTISQHWDVEVLIPQR